MKRATEALLLVVFLSGCILLNYAGSKSVFAASVSGASAKNPLLGALGETKTSLGDMLYLRSDAYFHGGLDSNLVTEHTESGEHHEEEVEPEEAPSIPSDWIGRVNSHIRVVDHRHLEASRAQEILPLLYAASRLDPANPDVALASAYWVERQTGSPANAARVLEEALARNPGSGLIQLELANLYAFKTKDPSRAVGYYQRALALLPVSDNGGFNGVRARFGLGNALEALGRREEALNSYKEALAAYPGENKTALRHELEAKIAQLQPN